MNLRFRYEEFRYELMIFQGYDVFLYFFWCFLCKSYKIFVDEADFV